MLSHISETLAAHFSIDHEEMRSMSSAQTTCDMKHDIMANDDILTLLIPSIAG